MLGVVGLAPAASSQCEAARPGLVAWWAGDGDASDRSGGHDAIPHNGASFAPGFVASATGQALSFDGADDFLAVPAAAELSMTAAYTIEAWVQSTGPSTDYRVIAIRGSGSSNDLEVYIQRSSNHLIVAHDRSNGGTFQFVGFAAPPAGVFFHLAVTFDGSAVHAYYDGVEPAIVQNDRFLAPPIYTDVGWELGRTQHSSFAGLGRFKGLLDEVSIYDRALTSAEVQAVHAAGSAGKCKDFDGDGLTDDDEALHFTDPFHPDTDGDGLLDGAEVHSYGTDPLNSDTDGDGLLDGVEVNDTSTDPLNPDTDGDGLSDGYEVTASGTDPRDPDTDGDGLGDAVDPTPLVPGATSGWLEDAARLMADDVDALSLGAFNGPNDNANKGRRNSLASRIRNAAKAITDDDYDTAIDLLEGVLAKLDGDPTEPDWMDVSTDQQDLAGELDLLIILLLAG